jgi:hypothetical protein
MSEEDDRQRWCGFNASILTQEGRRRDEALSEDEPEAASSSWLHREEHVTWRGGVVMSTGGEAAPGMRKGRDDAS